MKVGVVLNTSWNVYNFRMGLIKALQENGHEVIVFAPYDEYTPKLIDAGCEFYPVKMDSRGANPVKDFALIIELFTHYRKANPDILLHYTIKPNIYGTFAASMLGIPSINNVCGLGTAFLQENLVSKIALKLYKLAFKFPKKVYFQNIHDLNLFVDKKLIKPSITDLLPGSGINLDYFKPELIQKKKSKFTFLLISRLIHDKGILEYIEAIKILKSKGVDASFQLLGNKDIEHKRGIPEEIIQEWIDQNIVEYLGRTDDVRSFINNADCVVLPSYREGTPRTLLEAASIQKPIIATDVPGCTNIVQDQYNGLLCKKMDANDLADKMNTLMNLGTAKLKEFGVNGRMKVEEEFDEKIVIQKYLNTIHQASA